MKIGSAGSVKAFVQQQQQTGEKTGVRKGLDALHVEMDANLC